MRFIQRWLVCVFILVLAVSGLPMQAAKKAEATPPVAVEKAPAKGYEALIAEAKGFAAEKSWGKAQDAYTAALAVAPDPEAKRWCELWVTNAAKRMT